MGYRESSHQSAFRQHDVLDTMLTAADPVTGQRLSDENVRYQLVTFLIAGHETTSGMLPFAVYELLRHPDVLARARAEVDRVLGASRPEFEHLAQLSYVDKIFKETLRLWPTAPAFALQSLEEETTLGGYPVRRPGSRPPRTTRGQDEGGRRRHERPAFVRRRRAGAARAGHRGAAPARRFRRG